MKDDSKWAMRFVKLLAAFALAILAFVFFGTGLVVGGWLSLPFYVVACGTIVFIENMCRKGPENDWQVYVGIPILAIGFLLLALPSALKPGKQAPSNIIEFKKLEASSGILKDGPGRSYYITKKDGSNLILLCADNAGRYATQTCITDRLKSVIGQRVTVYHKTPFKISRMRAFFYEIRYNNVPLVNYDDVASSIKYRNSQDRRTSKDMSIMLAALAICSTIYVYIKRRRYQRRSTFKVDVD